MARVVRQCESVFAGGIDLAVLMVDNQSVDTTLDVARAALTDALIDEVYLLRNDANYGLGGSHKVAIRFAREHGFAYLIVLHGDDQGNLADMAPLLASGQHTDLDALLGARFQPGARLQGYSRLRTGANRAFNLVFSLVAGRRLYDLGSGLNLLRCSIFDDGFHERYADDLTFNYYLILGLVDRGCAIRFFPISWREDGQVSNARLFDQGLRMLRLLGGRIVNRRAFFAGEHRDTPRHAYPATIVYQRTDAAQGSHAIPDKAAP
ncbi:MAG: glycosyltransferase family 2 protein [Rudaea sp.]|nr:glycosyltransferase family 2 protein [Rudaea sp.]